MTDDHAAISMVFGPQRPTHELCFSKYCLLWKHGSAGTEGAGQTDSSNLLPLSQSIFFSGNIQGGFRGPLQGGTVYKQCTNMPWFFRTQKFLLCHTVGYRTTFTVCKCHAYAFGVLIVRKSPTQRWKYTRCKIFWKQMLRSINKKFLYPINVSRRVTARLSNETSFKRKPGNPHSFVFKPTTNPYVWQESNRSLQIYICITVLSIRSDTDHKRLQVRLQQFVHIQLQLSKLFITRARKRSSFLLKFSFTLQTL